MEAILQQNINQKNTPKLLRASTLIYSFLQNRVEPSPLHYSRITTIQQQGWKGHKGLSTVTTERVDIAIGNV